MERTDFPDWLCKRLPEMLEYELSDDSASETEDQANSQPCQAEYVRGGLLYCTPSVGGYVGFLAQVFNQAGWHDVIFLSCCLVFNS